MIIDFEFEKLMLRYSVRWKWLQSAKSKHAANTAIDRMRSYGLLSELVNNFRCVVAFIGSRTCVLCRVLEIFLNFRANFRYFSDFRGGGLNISGATGRGPFNNPDPRVRLHDVGAMQYRILKASITSIIVTFKERL